MHAIAYIPSLRLTAAYTHGRVLQLATYWPSLLLAAFATPLAYLLAFELLITPNFGEQLSSSSNYLEFATVGLAVGLNALTAAGYGLWPITAALSGNRRFITALQTPLGVWEVLLGEAVAVMIRMSLQVGGFFAVGIAMGAIQADETICSAFMAALLTCLCMFAISASITLWIRTARQYFFVIDRLVLLPLMLLSGTWCATASLPKWIQSIVWISPIWHGLEIARGYPSAVHVSILVASTTAGLTLSAAGLARRVAESSI